MKFSIIRAENKNETKETLIIPFAFPSDSMGTTAGVGSFAKGYGQDQLLVAGAVWGSVDELSTDWKYDGGVGLRAMVAGSVVRFDVAASEEATSAWVMFGHPF